MRAARPVAVVPALAAALAACTDGGLPEPAPLGPTSLPIPARTACPTRGDAGREVTVAVYEPGTLPVRGARVGYRTDRTAPWTPLGVTDEDGLLTAVVPDGAVVAPTEFGTTPVEACPGGVGAADGASAGGGAPLVAFVARRPLCRVTVAATRGGEPLDGAWVGYVAGTATMWQPWSRLARTDDEGLASVLAPCGPVAALVHAPDGCPAAGPAQVASNGAVLTAEVGVCPYELGGTVRDDGEDGAPVPYAAVTVGYQRPGGTPDTPLEGALRAPIPVVADGEGAYRVRVGEAARVTGPRTGLVVRASAPTRPAALAFPTGPDEGGALAGDVRLARADLVHVRCAGRPEESCADLGPVSCERRDRGWAPAALQEEAAVVIAGVPQLLAWCPEDPDGAGRIVHLGRASAVLHAGEDVAWIDFRDATGGVRATLPAGAAGDCAASLHPRGAPRPGERALTVTARVDGAAVRADAVPPGAWDLRWACAAASGVQAVEVGATTVDLGALGGG